METMEAGAAAAAFLSPATVHVTTVEAAMDAGVVTDSTRVVVDRAAVPAEIPVQVYADVGVTEVSKFTPAIVILLMLPIVAVVNVTVAETDVVALTLLERTIEGLVRAALNIAGKKTPEETSMFA